LKKNALSKISCGEGKGGWRKGLKVEAEIEVEGWRL
jgi:hypothetical protein